MDRLARRSLMLLVLAVVGLVVPTARAEVPEKWKSLDVAGLTALAKQYVARGVDGIDDCKALSAYVAQRYATDSAAGNVDWVRWLDMTLALSPYFSD